MSKPTDWKYGDDSKPVIWEDPIDKCCICLDGVDYSKATAVPCLHSFHVHCFEEWRLARWGMQITCPLCRSEVEAIEI